VCPMAVVSSLQLNIYNIPNGERPVSNYDFDVNY
jgi:hypothetical protein